MLQWLLAHGFAILVLASMVLTGYWILVDGMKARKRRDR
jgi:hypothetical protein